MHKINHSRLNEGGLGNWATLAALTCAFSSNELEIVFSAERAGMLFPISSPGNINNLAKKSLCLIQSTLVFVS